MGSEMCIRDSVTAGLVSDEIRNVLTVYEPRIAIEQLEVTVNSSLNGFEVLLYFVIIGRDDELLNLELFLERP